MGRSERKKAILPDGVSPSPTRVHPGNSISSAAMEPHVVVFPIPFPNGAAAGRTDRSVPGKRPVTDGWPDPAADAAGANPVLAFMAVVRRAKPRRDLCPASASAAEAESHLIPPSPPPPPPPSFPFYCRGGLSHQHYAFSPSLRPRPRSYICGNPSCQNGDISHLL